MKQHQDNVIERASEPRDDAPPVRLNAVPEMEVCYDCAQVVGYCRPAGVAPRVQYGRCPVHAPSRAAIMAGAWPGHDFNLHVDLCRCCGRVPLPSGSRFSVWFCAPCQEQVELLHARHGRLIMPFGRHAAHADDLLRSGRIVDPIAAEELRSATKAFGAVYALLDDWMRRAVRRNFRDSGVDPERVIVPIAEYWHWVRDRIDPDDRFREMCAFLEQAGRQAAGREAR